MSSPHTIPRTQRASILPFAGGDLKLVENHPVPDPAQLKPGQCLVKLTHSGVCHTDLSIKTFSTPSMVKEDLIGGHEGVGIVVAIADHTSYDGVRLGDRVGVKFMANSCLKCEACLKGLENLCRSLQKSGVNIDGTFCEYVLAYVTHVTPIPDTLESPAAAAIMCAGISAYSALMQSNTRIGDWVVIPGAGGGIGHLVIQYAVAMGLHVVAIDTGTAKRDLCLSLGAEKWIDFKERADIVSDVIAATDGGAHAAIVAAGGNGAYEVAAAYLRSSGYLMVVGIPPDSVLTVPLMLIAARGLTIRGVFAANRQQSLEAVKIAASGKVKCHLTIRGLSELEHIYEEMEKGQIIGRVVLDISK